MILTLCGGPKKAQDELETASNIYLNLSSLLKPFRGRFGGLSGALWGLQTPLGGAPGAA